MTGLSSLAYSPGLPSTEMNLTRSRNSPRLAVGPPVQRASVTLQESRLQYLQPQVALLFRVEPSHGRQLPFVSERHDSRLHFATGEQKRPASRSVLQSPHSAEGWTERGTSSSPRLQRRPDSDQSLGRPNRPHGTGCRRRSCGGRSSSPRAGSPSFSTSAANASRSSASKIGTERTGCC